MISRLGRLYGASPLHLLGHVVVFVVAAYALAQMLAGPTAGRVILWLLGAVLLHDLVLLPAYSALDRGAQRALAGRLHVAPTNFLRVPVVLSGLALLVYFPPILGRNDATFLRVSGHRPEHYARDWLLLTLAAFAVSGGLYALRLLRSR